MDVERKIDIGDRSLEFAMMVGKFVLRIPQNQLSKEYCRQLIRSSASIGANIEEADGALTRKDFINKLGISRREARETRYWFRLIKKTEIINNSNVLQELDLLICEAKELLLILSAIIKNSRS